MVSQICFEFGTQATQILIIIFSQVIVYTDVGYSKKNPFNIFSGTLILIYTR